MAVPPDSSRVRDNVRGQTLMKFSAALFVPVIFVHTRGTFWECPQNVLRRMSLGRTFPRIKSILRHRCFPVKLSSCQDEDFRDRRRSVCVSAFYKKGPGWRERRKERRPQERWDFRWIDDQGTSMAGRADVRGANIIEVARAGVSGCPAPSVSVRTHARLTVPRSEYI
ncbi:hypothetical protein ALC57_16262 [Trachymyrmex cornetzi]|uniref:Uncharacterized protein n=1 Tax=Trachymyrmex cornetzi TaxID=471704 RepID=A0A195DFK9_9HYME|nr:hypothetical protein ALC57_16262 [Trachymyrmex cornetzi]